MRFTTFRPKTAAIALALIAGVTGSAAMAAPTKSEPVKSETVKVAKVTKTTKVAHHAAKPSTHLAKAKKPA